MRPTGPLSVRVCSDRATEDPAHPKVIAGLEVEQRPGGTMDVWTLCGKETDPARQARLGRIRLHCVPRDDRGCGTISIDPSLVATTALPRITLVANLHRKAQGHLQVHFSEITLPSTAKPR